MLYIYVYYNVKHISLSKCSTYRNSKHFMLQFGLHDEHCRLEHFLSVWTLLLNMHRHTLLRFQSSSLSYLRFKYLNLIYPAFPLFLSGSSRNTWCLDVFHAFFSHILFIYLVFSQINASRIIVGENISTHLMPSISCALLNGAASRCQGCSFSTLQNISSPSPLRKMPLCDDFQLLRSKLLSAGLGGNTVNIYQACDNLDQSAIKPKVLNAFKQLKLLCSSGSFDIFLSVCLWAVLPQSFNRTCQQSRQFLSTSV